MEPLTHSLERTIVILAAPETVFRFFTDSNRWAAWWGAGSSIEPHAGGKVTIQYPNAVRASGEVVEISAPQRIAFTFGYDSGQPIPPGASRVTIRLEPDARGTRLHLLHEFADASVRDHHLQGWRFQLSLFANAVADEVNAAAVEVVDGWLAAWSITNETERRAALSAVVVPAVRFGDRYSALEGIEEIVAHIGAAQRFMPPMRLQRVGGIRHCQGVVLAEWAATGADGQARGTGTNVFTLDSRGRIESVTGFWNAAAGKTA